MFRGKFDSVKFVHIDRNFSGLAHKLVRTGLYSDPQLWISHFPIGFLI